MHKSNTLDKNGKIEMGPKLFLSIFEPDLCSGNTVAYFHSEMNLPGCKERFRMKARGWAKMGAAALRCLPGLKLF